jgi:hypothetical protein
MNNPKAKQVEVITHYILDDDFASELRAFGISQLIIDSLRVAMENMTNTMDAIGHNYARGMRQALLDYGLNGVKHQVSCMLSRMRKWRGNEARHHKHILRKWIK